MFLDVEISSPHALVTDPSNIVVFGSLARGGYQRPPRLPCRPTGELLKLPDTQASMNERSFVRFVYITLITEHAVIGCSEPSSSFTYGLDNVSRTGEGVLATQRVDF